MILKGKYAASNFFRRRGVELNLEKKCFRETEKVFSFIPINEKCRPIPKPEYILIFKTLYAKCESCSIENFEDKNSGTVQLSIVYNKNRRLIIHESENRKEIFEMAGILSKELKTGIRDSATDRRNPKFIPYKAA